MIQYGIWAPAIITINVNYSSDQHEGFYSGILLLFFYKIARTNYV